MQIICTSLRTDNHASTSSLNFFTGWMLVLTPNQQCQSTEGSCGSPSNTTWRKSCKFDYLSKFKLARNLFGSWAVLRPAGKRIVFPFPLPSSMTESCHCNSRNLVCWVLHFCNSEPFCLMIRWSTDCDSFDSHPDVTSHSILFTSSNHCPSFVITFCVIRRRRKMYCGHARLCVCVCPRPYAHTTARTRM